MYLQRWIELKIHRKTQKYCWRTLLQDVPPLASQAAATGFFAAPLLKFEHARDDHWVVLHLPRGLSHSYFNWAGTLGANLALLLCCGMQHVFCCKGASA